MCQNETDYNNAIKYLKTSPMFNLSLSSKELFHSNFLYWIAQKDKSAFKALIEALKIKIDWPKNDENWEVCREHKNFDLCVCEKEKELLVIENKFKSLPDKAQLDKYDKKLTNKDCKKILLSLPKPFIGKQGNWQWKSYQPLVKKLYEIKGKFNNKYDISLIEDYCDFVNNIITLTGIWIEKDKQDGAPFLLDYKADDLKHEEDSESKDNVANKCNKCNYYSDAKELRIHDLYGKYRTERLRVMLQEKIDELSERNGLEIITNTAYSRSLPILEVVIRGVGEPKDTENNKEPEAFFISIQGNQYRHAINARDNDEGTKEKRIESSKDKIKVTTAWHSFLDPNDKPQNEWSWFPDSEILANSGQRNNVCSFAGKGGVNYIYQYKKITANATIKQVLDLMVNDVKKIIENFNKNRRPLSESR